jgi:hypothetical protein
MPVTRHPLYFLIDQLIMKGRILPTKLLSKRFFIFEQETLLCLAEDSGLGSLAAKYGKCPGFSPAAPPLLLSVLYQIPPSSASYGLNFQSNSIPWSRIETPSRSAAVAASASGSA